MSEKMLDLSSGTLYIQGLNGVTQKLGDIKEGVVEPISLDDILPSFARLNNAFEAKFECTSRIDELVILIMTGTYDAIMNACPNKRVVHLAKYGRKKRTRKKNLHRAIKILEGMSNGSC